MKDATRMAVTGAMGLSHPRVGLGHLGGALLGLVVGSGALLLPWRGQPMWRWTAHYIGQAVLSH